MDNGLTKNTKNYLNNFFRYHSIELNIKGSHKLYVIGKKQNLVYNISDKSEHEAPKIDLKNICLK